MAEKDQVLKEKVEHSGIFNFADFYKFAHSFLTSDKGYGVSEDKYSEKSSGNSRNIRAEWKATKKISDYFSVTAGIEIEASDLVDVEAIIDGEKKKMNKGKISVSIAVVVIKDPDSKWETTPHYRFLRDIYNKFIIPARVEAIEKKAAGDFIEFKEEIKSFLELTAKR